MRPAGRPQQTNKGLGQSLGSQVTRKKERKSGSWHGEDLFDIIRNPPETGVFRIFEKIRILGHDQRPYLSRYNTRNSHDPISLRPLKPRRGTMASPQTHPR